MPWLIVDKIETTADFKQGGQHSVFSFFWKANGKK